MKTFIRRSSTHLAWLLILLAQVACGVTDASKTETHTGLLQEAGGGASFLLPIGKPVEARLTWTVPAEGTRPIAQLRLETLGVGDTITESAPSDTPPIVFSGTGDFIIVACLNCQGLAPIPFTLTVTRQ
jgi:hypothetical protein